MTVAEQEGPPTHWLGCKGFLVDSPGGRVGIVEDVLCADEPDRPEALVVRAGPLGSRVLFVPVEEVKEIVPQAERIVVGASPRLLGTVSLADWRRPSAERSKVA